MRSKPVGVSKLDQHSCHRQGFSSQQKGQPVKAKLALVSVLTSAIMVCGCFQPAVKGVAIYPVQGPQAALAPAPVYTAAFPFRLSVLSPTKISMVLGNGESFKGKFNVATASAPNSKTHGTPSSYPPQPNLAFAWDAVYGKGYFVAHILGKSIAGAALTGTQGTVLQVEFKPVQEFVQHENEFGVAIDNKGNVYKVVL